MEKFNMFLRRYTFLFGAVLKLNSVRDFVILFDNPDDLVFILKTAKLTESFYKELLIHLKSNPNFYEKVVKLYILLKAKKERAKNLFLNLIENEWIRNNVIFYKGPIMSYQLHNNIDERLYTDIDILINKQCIDNLLINIKKHGHYNDIKFGKFLREIYIIPEIGLVDVMFRDYIPFNINVGYTYINDIKLMTLNIIDAAKISMFFGFFEIRYLDVSLLRNILLTDNIVGSNTLEHDCLYLIHYVYTKIIGKDYNDKILRDFCLITFNSKNILKKIFYLLKFMRKYNIKYSLSYFYTGKQYLFRKIMNIVIDI